MENDALPERGEPIVLDPNLLAAVGLDAAEIEIMCRLRSDDRDGDRPWFNIFMGSREG